MITATLNHIKDFHHWTRLEDNKYDIGMFANVVPNPETDGYIGACRSGYADLNDTIDVLKYDKDLQLLSRQHATKGEDPRTFMFNGRPYSLTWDPHHTSGGLVLSYKLIDLLDAKTVTLDIENFGTEPGDLPVLGKNWMPLVAPDQQYDELYIAVTIDPVISVLRCNVQTGHCSWVTPLDRVQGGIQVSISRGGTPLIYSEANDIYVGLGHRTYDTYNHKPFLYTLTKHFTESTIGEDIITGKEFVEDPQSIFIENGKIYCCIGNNIIYESGAVVLYEVEISHG